MEKLLMISPYPATFIKGDFDQLSKHYSVTLRQQNWKSRTGLPFNLIRQFFYLLFNFRKFDACIIQFAGYWSLIPTLMSKVYNVPVFIILHGSDCAAIPSISYGNLLKKPMRWFIQKSMKKATELWPVSDSLIKTKNTYFKFESEKGSEQGYQNIIGPINTPCTVISNGLDFDFWKIQKEESPANTFISVVSGEAQFKRKGIDLILEVAPQLSDCTFSIVGMSKPENIQCPNNVIFHGRVSQEKMIELFSKHQYYLQLSVFEGFGLALCESMLCYCIPIVSNVNILPKIIGNSGFVLEQRDKEALTSLIHSLNNINTEELEEKAREAITSKYDINTRIEKIKQRIEFYKSK